MDQLALGLQVHRAPRVLRAAGTLGPVLSDTGRSILAGCSLSTSLSRAFLRDPVQDCQRTAASGDGQVDHLLGQHVDDLAQILRADSDRSLLQATVRLGTALATSLADSKLSISTKSRVLASTPALARAIQCGLVSPSSIHMQP